jgi:hypothetical protein
VYEPKEGKELNVGKDGHDGSELDYKEMLGITN